MGKQQKRTNPVFDGLDNNNPDPNDSFFVEATSFKRGSFSSLEDTNKGVDLEEYKGYLGEGVFSINSASDNTRARNQSNWEQTYNAALKFVPNVALEVLNQTGALLDIEDYANSDKEIGNWLSTWAQEQKENINEANPIYRENPGEALDVGDFAWWMENGSSLAESVTAFAAVGALTGAGTIKALTSGAKALEWLSVLGKGANATNTGKKALQGISSLNTAFLLNHAEGMGIATSVYDTVYQEELKKLKAENVENAEELAKTKASKKAVSALDVNKINILLNLSSASLFVKTPKLTRQLRKQASLKESFKRANIEGVQEGVEESINMIAEEQALDDDYTLNKGLEDVFSKKGLESALLGYIGGAGQTSITNAGRKIKLQRDKDGIRQSAYSLQNQAFNEQNESKERISALNKGNRIADNTDALMRAEEVFELQKQIVKAEESNNFKKSEELKAKLLSNQAFDAFANGTTEQLLNFFEGIKSLEGSDAEAKGLEKDTYKENAEDAISFIESLEDEYNKSYEYLNTSDVYSNRSRNVRLRITKNKLENNKSILQEKAKQDLVELGLKEDEIEINEAENFVIKNNNYKEQAKQLESINLYATLINDIKEIKTTQKELAKEYTNLISSDTQKAIKNKITEEKKEKITKEKRKATKEKVKKQNAQKAKVKEQVTKEKETVVTPTTPVSSNKGETEVETVTSNVPAFTTTSPFLEEVVEKANKIINDNSKSNEFKIEALNKGIAVLAKNSKLEGAKGLIAQYKKGIRVLEGEEKVIEENKEIANNQKQILKSKLQAVSDSLQDKEDDNAPITEKDKEAIFKKVNVLVDALNTMEEMGYDVSDFKVVADAMQETVGEEKFINIFEDFKSVYNLTNKASYKITDTYEALYFSEEEKQAVVSHQKMLEINTFLMDFYNLTNSEFEAKKDEVLKAYIEEQGYTVYSKDTLNQYEGYKVVEGFNKVAYLAKRYENNIDVSSSRFNVLDFIVSKKDVDRKLNEKVDSVLLDPQYLKEGESITFRVLDEVIYDDGTIVTKEGEITKNGEVTKRNPVDIAPIALFYKGKQIKGAYLHTADWISEKNIADKNDVNRQKNLIKKIRETILSSEKPITTTIKERKDGWLLKDINGNKDLVSINLPKVEIGIGKDDFIFSGDNQVKTSNKTVVNGLPYAIIPVNTNKKVGIPVQPLSLKDKPEYITSMVNAVRIYLDGKLDERADKIYTETGLNLTDVNDLEVYLNNFIYLKPYKKGTNNDYTFDTFKENLNLTKDNLSVIRFIDGELQFGRGLGVNGSVGYINKAEINRIPSNSDNLRQKTIDKELEKFEDVLSNNTYINVNKELLNNSKFNLITITETDAQITNTSYNDFIKEHLKTDLYSTTLDNGTEVYTVQSTIEFNDDFISNTKKEVKEVKEVAKETNDKTITKNDTTYIFGDIDESADDLAPKVLTTDQEQEIKETTPESLLIQGVTLNTQNTIINHLSSKFLQYAIKEKDLNKAFDFISVDFPDLLTAALRHYNDNYKESNSVRDLKNVNIIKALKNNYSKLSNLTVNKLKQVNYLEVNFNDRVLTALAQDLNEFENSEEENYTELDVKELNNWENDASFRENIKEKMSTNLKNFFSYIEDAKINAKKEIVPKVGLLGIIETVPTDVVINDLNAILAYHNDLNNKVVVEPTFENMIEVLTSWTDKKPYLLNVLEELKTADEKIQNEFVQVMSKHYTNHILVGKTKQGGYYVKNSDNNSIVKVIQQNWLNNIISNNLLTLNDSDILIVNDNKLKEVISNAKKLKTALKNKEEVTDFAKKVLFDLGMDFDSNLVNTLINEGIFIKGKRKSLYQLLNDSDGAINNYINTLNNLKGKNLQENHPFKDNSSLKEFTRAIGKANPVYFANSFKDVRGKSYFGYSNNKFLVDRVKNLKHNRNGLLEKLSKQPFTSNSIWVNQLLNNPKFKEHFNYFTFDGVSSPFKDEGIKLEYASPSEIEEAKLALFYSKTKYAPKNKGINPLYIVNLFYPTTSNKTVQYGIQTLGEEWGKGLINGKLHKRQQNKLFDVLVQPEINRILSLQSEPDKYNIKGYDKGGLMFHFLPALNSMKELWNEDGTLKGNIHTDIILKNKVLFELRKYVYELVEDKLTKWNEYGFIENFEEIQTVDENLNGITIKPTKLKFSERYKDDQHGARKEAYNFVLNYLVSNVNVFQTFTTDPAFYYKTNEWRKVLNNTIIQDKLIKDGYGESREEVVSFFNGLQKETGNAKQRLLPYYSTTNHINEHEDIFNNIGKRLAADAAPGVDIPNSPNDTFTLGYLKDNERPVYLYSYYKALLGANAKDYLKANSTDAQEFTTLKEHLHILNKQGKIYTKDMEAILLAEKNGKDLTDVQLNLVFQPLKPVYVQNVWKSGIERRIYVKSSSFPLFKQLTKGLEIDKLRKALVEQGVDRVAFESAVKIGGSNTPTEVYNNEEATPGKINDNITLDVIGTLTREGFKIQQEVPYNESKDYINDGTQQIKLLTANIRDILGFKIPNDADSSYTGQEIQDELDKAYHELFEMNYNELIKELDYDEINGSINIKELSRILREEALTRNYPLYEIEALETEIDKDGNENFVVPLWLTGVSGKLESMLNSIVDNRVRKLKPKGKSFVLGSSEGFSPNIVEGEAAQEKINNTTGIVWDKDWYTNSKGQLAPMRILDKNGVLYGESGFDAESSYVAHAEILVPFKFKDSNGEVLSVEDYIDENGFINTNKITPELLNIFGFRIPTQYLNSMSAIKIVGFLPKKSGDLLLAPADWTIQMGSDFDVDKLYSNNYNTQYNEETGGLSVYREGDNRKQVLENRILDLHFAILDNPNPEIQRRILKPLDFGMLKELGEELLPYVDNRLKGIGISESYQAWKYLNARAGKAGIGVFSTDNTFISQVQNKDIKLSIKRGKKYVPYFFRLGGKMSNKISDSKTITGNRDKTDVISAYQSLAVDDENEQGLFKLNINNTTFDAIRTLVMSGFEEDVISYFINQPIIREYSRLKVKADDSITDFSASDIYVELNKKFPITDSTLTLQDASFYNKYETTSKEDLLKNITSGKADPNAQQVIYSQFLSLTEYGKNIQYVQSAINTHSAGFGKDLYYSTIKQDQVIGLGKYMRVSNASNLIGDYFALEQVADEVLDAKEFEYTIESNKSNLYALLENWNRVYTNEDKLKIVEELLELGYKAVTPIKSNESIATNIQFIKPTTLAGVASTNALVLNNKLWERFFPYNNVGVNWNIDSVLSITGRGERLANQASNKKKAFDNLKSFSITKVASTFTTDNVIDERNRLLIDTKENQSLATIINILRQNGKLNNAFVNRLNLDIKKEVLPSNITYQAATAENIDERHLHSAFSAMLLNDTIDLGEFNGINYTPRKVAQDLITSQLLSGGVQKATQFIKYIPINYLKTIGYYKALEDINYEKTSDINPQSFGKQFAQHNPASVKLREEQLEGLKTNYIRYNNNTIIKKKANAKPLSIPAIFSIKNEKALSGYNIYFYNKDIGHWEQKDTLGTNNLIEYNADNLFGTTIIKSNKVPVVTNRTLPTKPKDVKEILDSTKNSENQDDLIYTNDNTIEGYYNLNEEGSTENKLGYIIDKIINADNSDNFTKLMAKEVIKNLHKIKEYKFIVNDLLEAKGSHNIKDKTIKINPSQHEDKADFEATILEEVIHALTKKAILENNTGEVARLKSLLSTAQRKVKEYIAKEMKVDANVVFENVKAKLEQGKALTEFESNVVYPVLNETEFVGRLFKSKKLQELLNDTNSSIKGKSILEDVWEFVKEALKAIGIDIKKDSALEYALTDIISLINSPTPTNNQLQEVSKLDPTFRTVEFINKRFNLVTEDGEAVPVSKLEGEEIVNFINNNIENLTAKYIDNYVYVESINKYKDGEQTSLDLNPATTQVGKARPLLLAYNNRIKRLEKNINKAEAQKQLERVEILKEDLEVVLTKRNETMTLTSLRNRSSDNSDLYFKGVQDLEEVRTMLNGNRNITLEDTLYIRKVLHFWQKGTSVLFSKEDKKSEALLKDFKALEMDAETLEDKLVTYEEKFINDFIKKHGHNITVQEIFENFKDINGLTAKALDISRSGNQLLDAVFLSVKNANIDALDEGNDLLVNLENLEQDILPILKSMGHKELYEVFRQRNSNNKLTGHLVQRFTNNFNKSYYSKLNNLYKNNNSVNFDTLINWSADNLKNINLRYLFLSPVNTEEKAKATKYKEELKNELGELHFNEFMLTQSKKINDYNARVKAKLQTMADKYGVSVKDITSNPDYRKEINNWEATNSPYRYYDYMSKGVPSSVANFKNFNNSNYITIVPKNDKAYDSNYKQIENNEKLLEFYNYYKKVDNQLKTYLPEDVRRTLSYTGIPFIKKTILNLYKDKGMKVGLTPIWDNIRESVRSVEESVISSKSVDPVTNKEEKGLKVNLSNNNSQEISDYITYKTIEAKNKGKEVTDDMVQKWKEDKIDELAQLKSYDLSKILKVYTLTTLAYKHKSKIEDSIELAQNILNTQKEYHRTNKGELKVDDDGRPVNPKNAEQSFTNLKKQFEYFVESFKGNSKLDEGVTKTLILTASEKAEKKKLEKAIEDSNKALQQGTIDEGEHTTNITLLQDNIDKLGGYAVNSKRGDNVLKWVQLVKMGWNLMSSVANVGFGYIANRIEASGGQLYTNEQLTKAYKLTGQSIWKNATFNTMETPVAKKIRTFMDNWDVLKDASHEMFQRPLDIDLGKKTKWLSPYNVTQRTEYINQAPIMVAMMMNKSLSDFNIDTKDNLWDAYTTDGNWNTKKYGKEPAELKDFVKLLRNKIDQVNKMNHGNYDPTSSIALKKEFWGRAISQFRTWMFEGYAVRFENEKPDALLGTRKGRYISTRDFYKEVGFGKATIASLKGLVRSLTLGTVFKNNTFEEFNTKDNNLKDVDIANLRKTMTELAMYSTLYTSYLILKAINDGLDDDDDRKYALNLLINQGMRLKTDIIFYLNPGEFKNLLRDLVPAASIITDATQFVGAVSKFVQGEDEIGSGINSGQSRLLRESSQLLPVGTQVYKTINYGVQTFDK